MYSLRQKKKIKAYIQLNKNNIAFSLKNEIAEKSVFLRTQKCTLAFGGSQRREV